MKQGYDAFRMKPRGLYELLLTKALAELLTQLPDNLEPLSEPLRSAEAADHFAAPCARKPCRGHAG
jgi:hypothetical protein